MMRHSECESVSCNDMTLKHHWVPSLLMSHIVCEPSILLISGIRISSHYLQGC